MTSLRMKRLASPPVPTSPSLSASTSSELLHDNRYSDSDNDNDNDMIMMSVVTDEDNQVNSSNADISSGGSTKNCI